MAKRDIVWHLRRIGDAMGFRVMEGDEDITDTVTEIRLFLTKGLVYSSEMVFEDGSIWTGEFQPLP